MGVTTRKNKRLLIPGLFVAFAFGFGALTAHTKAIEDKPEIQSEPVSPAKRITETKDDPKVDDKLSPIDEDALSLAHVTQTDFEADQDLDRCKIHQTQKIDGVGLQYLICSEKTITDESRPFEIAEEFTVPPVLAKRFHFWRRIYSLWSKHHYVLHLAPWPEVVIEAYEFVPDRDVSPSAPAASQPAIDGSHLIKKLADNRREAYAKIFRRMHDISSTPARFTPAMQRLAKAMEHISEPNKYLTASENMRLQRGQKDFIAQGLSTAPKYLPWIEREFASLGVPKELAKLAFIESSFNLKALSKVGASGVYQIMPETGKQYLRIQDGIDERNDPIKAGRAAARLLKFYYGSLGSWPLAITAYNHGVGGIRRAMATVGSDRLEDLITRYEGSGFGFASKNFYTGFLAILATLENKERYFPNIKKVSPIRFKLVRVASPLSIDSIQKTYRLNPSEILRLNPDLSQQFVRSRGILPKNYVLKVSTGGGVRLATTDSGKNDSDD
jgi:membrane-bound lytic murein transglycosylase D